MENQLRIKNYPNDKEAIQFLPEQADLLDDQSMLMTMHYTRGIIKDGKVINYLYVGKKGYDFFVPKALANEINKMIKKYNMPLLMNMRLRDGKHSDYIVNHALVVATRPTKQSDNHKPLIDSDTMMKFTFKPMEKKRSIICTMFPAPKEYLDRLISFAQKQRQLRCLI